MSAGADQGTGAQWCLGKQPYKNGTNNTVELSSIGAAASLVNRRWQSQANREFWNVTGNRITQRKDASDIIYLYMQKYVKTDLSKCI